MCTMQPQVVQLQSSLLLLFLASATVAAVQASEYAPGPQPGQETGGPAPFSPPAPTSYATASPPSYLAPAPAPPAAHGQSPREAPTTSPDTPSPGPAASAYIAAGVIWCAVREEFDACITYTSLLSTPDLPWSCVSKESKGDCMDAIDGGDANLMSLEAGLAYIAFLGYSMKAILAEEYTFHAQSYGAMAVVNKQMCDDNPKLKLEDFRSLKSCHSEYLSAAGWNYPVQALLHNPVDNKVLSESLPNDVKVITNFFSASCAPSELGDFGVCTACGNGDNGSFCSSANTQYTGEDGAFRCLMEEMGDIAFLRARTPTLYSSDGLNSQSWSIKSVDEFMYLCPSGGCKAINDNYGSCQFGSVPANVVMTQNSLPEPLKQTIITTLLEANWTQALYTGRNWQNYLLSVSTQGLVQVNQLTRAYLGTSALVTQTIVDLAEDEIHLTARSAVQSRVPANSLSFALGALAIGVLGAFCSL